MHAEMPLASFLCAAFLFVPLRQFSKSADLPGIVLTAWLILLNVVGALNTIIWANSTDIIAEPWCDIGMFVLFLRQWGHSIYVTIVTKLIVGFHMVLPSCCLCIAINAEHKYHPVQGRPLPQTALSRKVVQLSLCFLIPVIYMALRTSHLGPK
jgi:pheromone a factor receptor